MTKIMMEIKDCEDCPHCRTERFYTEDSWEHAENYYCRKIVGNKQFPCTDHHIAELRELMKSPGIIGIYIERRSELGPVPEWCPLKVKE